MQQLLPEVRSILPIFGNGDEVYVDSPPISKKWEAFVAFITELDSEIEKEKRNILLRVPHDIKTPLMEALSTKRNNDRALNGYIGIIAVGKDPGRFINILFALEALDCSVLIVDDIFDKAEVRANKPAHHKTWGQDITLVAAMFLKSLSSQIIIASGLKDITKLNILDEMENLHSKIYEGQFLDIEYEKKSISEISEKDYMKMISLTTGYQIAGGLRIGGIIGEANSSTISFLGEIGWRIGVLGQIRDDVVDYLPDEKKIWKTPLLDFMRNKKRIPLLIGWRNATDTEKRTLDQLQRKKQLNNRDHITILEILMKPSNIEKIRAIMEELKEEACQIIDKGDLTSEGNRLLKTYISYGMGEI